MDKNTIASIIILGLIIAFSIAIYSDLTKNPNEDFFSGVKFTSDSKKPEIHLKELSLKSTFVISPEFTNEPSSINSKMTDVITRFNIVLTYAGKNPLVVARSFDSKGLVSCYTNDGSYLVGKEISVDECNSILNNPDYVVILVAMPSNANGPSVSIAGNKINISPASNEEISSLPHLVLRIMFGDLADNAINASNIKTDQISK